MFLAWFIPLAGVLSVALSGAALSVSRALRQLAERPLKVTRIAPVGPTDLDGISPRRRDERARQELRNARELFRGAVGTLPSLTGISLFRSGYEAREPTLVRVGEDLLLAAQSLGIAQRYAPDLELAVREERLILDHPHVGYRIQHPVLWGLLGGWSMNPTWLFHAAAWRSARADMLLAHKECKRLLTVVEQGIEVLDARCPLAEGPKTALRRGRKDLQQAAWMLEAASGELDTAAWMRWGLFFGLFTLEYEKLLAAGSSDLQYALHALRSSRNRNGDLPAVPNLPVVPTHGLLVRTLRTVLPATVAHLPTSILTALTTMGWLNEARAHLRSLAEEADLRLRWLSEVRDRAPAHRQVVVARQDLVAARDLLLSSSQALTAANRRRLFALFGFGREKLFLDVRSATGDAHEGAHLLEAAAAQLPDLSAEIDLRPLQVTEGVTTWQQQNPWARYVRPLVPSAWRALAMSWVHVRNLPEALETNRTLLAHVEAGLDRTDLVTELGERLPTAA